MIGDGEHCIYISNVCDAPPPLYISYLFSLSLSLSHTLFLSLSLSLSLTLSHLHRLRIEENYNCADLTLTDEVVSALDAIGGEEGVHYCWNPENVK